MTTETRQIVTVLTVQAEQAIAAANSYGARITALAAGMQKLDGASALSERAFQRQKQAVEGWLRANSPAYEAHQKLAAGQRQLADVTEGLAARLRTGAVTAEDAAKAAAMLSARSAELAVIQQRLQAGAIGAEEATRALAQAMTPAAAVIARQKAELQALSDRLDPAGASLRRIAADQDVLNAALAAGRIDPARHRDLTRVLEGEAAAHGKVAKAAGFSYQNQEILRSGVINLAQSLIAGQRPLEALLVQGSQTAPVLAEVAASAALIAAPMIAVGAAVALVAGKAVSLQGELRRTQASLAAYGSAAAFSARQVQELATAMTAIGGSRADNLAAVLALANRQDLRQAPVADIARLVPDFAAATGGDAAAAARTLGDAYAKGAEGLVALGSQYDLISPKLAEHIRALELAGRRSEALALATTALQGRFSGIAREMRGPVGEAFHQLAVNFDNLLETAARSKPVVDTLTALANALANLARTGAQVIQRETPEGQLAWLQQQRQELEATYQAAQKVQNPGIWGSRDQWDAWIESFSTVNKYAERAAALDSQIATKQQEVDRIRKGEATAAAEAQAAATAKLNAELERNHGLTDTQAKDLAKVAEINSRYLAALSGPAADQAVRLARLQAEEEARGAENASTASIEAAGAEAARRARGELDNAIDHAIRQSRVQTETTIALAEAWQLGAGAVKDAERAQRLELEVLAKGEAYRRQLTAASDAQADAERRVADATEQAAVRQKALNDQLAAAALAGDRGGLARLVADRTAEVRTLYDLPGLPHVNSQEESAITAAGGAYAAVQQRIAAGTLNSAAATRELELIQQAYKKSLDDTNLSFADWLALYRQGDAAARARTTQDEIKQRREELDLLQQETALRLGTWDPEEAERQVALLQRRIELERQLIDPLSDQGRELLELFQRQQALTLATERHQAAVRELEGIAEQAFTGMGDSIVDALARGENAWVAFGNAAIDVLNQVLKELLKLAAVNPALNYLFGGSRSTLSDAGGLFGSLFGGGSSFGLYETSSTVVSPIGTIVGGLHEGGIAGGEPSFRRGVDPAIFASAPRFHDGRVPGLGPHELPAILLDDEEVLTRQDPRHRWNLGAPANDRGQGELKLTVQVIDQGGAERSGPPQVATSRGPDGGVVLKIVMPEIKRDLSFRGPLAQALEAAYGLKRRGT
ncbi:MAG: hypothetical protein GC191_09515 [Azospirillum sp.]|nr:hypothetical protein [Azospirillum sp.]